MKNNTQQLLENKVRKIYKKILSEETLNVKNIASMTNNNDHTGAVLELAKALKSTRAIKILTGVQMIHDAEGSIPPEIRSYRDGWLKKLLDTVKSQYGESEYNRIYRMF